MIMAFQAKIGLVTFHGPVGTEYLEQLCCEDLYGSIYGK
ncbi:hypothetical protein [Sphingobacterium daejeonense]|nr:hypothetical protein [Sphingobacterium daejeonense]